MRVGVRIRQIARRGRDRNVMGKSKSRVWVSRVWLKLVLEGGLILKHQLKSRLGPTSGRRSGTNPYFTFSAT